MTSSLNLFQIFVGVVGAIALSLAFFLLKISTTQNIKENVWEYGCLRAMGLTCWQGMMASMYEQYSVIVASMVLGLVTGIILSVMCTAQFYLFLELPMIFKFPFELVLTMMTLAMFTTFFAVYLPIRKLNKCKISRIVKGLDND